MKYSQIRKEKSLKEIRYYILNGLKDMELINEAEFKSYAVMIVKMYELNYYDEYEHILADIEEKALTELVELVIQLIDEEGIEDVSSNLRYLIKHIEFMCIEKQYINLSGSLLELEEMI